MEILPVQQNVTIEPIETVTIEAGSADHDLEYTALGVIHENDILPANTEALNICFDDLESMETDLIAKADHLLYDILLIFFAPFFRL